MSDDTWAQLLSPGGALERGFIEGIAYSYQENKAFDDTRGCLPQLIEVTATYAKFGQFDNNHNYYPGTSIMVHIIAIGKK